jgi:hypothetical protein
MVKTRDSANMDTRVQVNPCRARQMLGLYALRMKKVNAA